MVPRSSTPRRFWPLSALAALCLVAAGCSTPGTPGGPTNAAATNPAGPVHPAVQRAQAAVQQQLEHANPADFADARRGFIAAPSGQVRNEAGQVIWDHDAFAFQKAEQAVAGDPLRLWRVGKAHLSIRYVRLKNNSMRGIIDRDAINAFFDDCVGYGISRVEEWVTLPRSRQAMLESVWNGMCYLTNWWEEGGEPR